MNLETCYTPNKLNWTAKLSWLAENSKARVPELLVFYLLKCFGCYDT